MMHYKRNDTLYRMLYPYRNTSLHKAAQLGSTFDKILIEKILVKRTLNINAEDVYGNTPLHYAAEEGHLEVVIMLLKHRADVNAKQHFSKRTSLHIAALNGYIEIAKLLIEKGANVYVQDINGNTPMDIAKKSGNQEIAKLLEKNTSK
ncbi:MAG: ankyrin repeat domain-containing protein [Candidatus Amoebophilus sp.]